MSADTAARRATSTGAEPLIEARGLRAGYGEIEVVRNLDLEVRPGEVVALLGANGAGKTTTVLTLSGELPSLGGEVRWLGEPTTSALHVRARQGLGLVTEERSIFPGLTVRETLRVSGCDLDDALAMFPELTSRLRVRAGMLSGGEQQMLALARILCRDPKALLADELSFGLAPIVVDRLLDVVRAAADRGVAVLLVEQHIKKVMAIADRVYVLKRGELVLSGAAADLRDELGSIQSSYLSEAG